MKIMVDTNIILDILLQREPFLQDSLHALDEAIIRDYRCLMSVSAATDVYYCLRKAVHSEERAHRLLKRVSTFAHFTSVYEVDLEKALESEISDFEDALVDTVAFRENCDLILTRNTADFSLSKVEAVTPVTFLKRIGSNPMLE